MAAMKGYIVTVYDKDTHLGGTFRSAAYSKAKGELTTVIYAFGYKAYNLLEEVAKEFEKLN